LLCHRSVYPQRLSPAAKAKKAARQREHQRQKTRALHVLAALGGPPLGF
jgi:hypothetical protein